MAHEKREDLVVHPGDARGAGMHQEVSELPAEELKQEILPKLQHAGPSAAFARLNIERSGPSGNLSKLYNLKVKTFAD